jgi:hypothetical protein
VYLWSGGVVVRRLEVLCQQQNLIDNQQLPHRIWGFQTGRLKLLGNPVPCTLGIEGRHVPSRKRKIETLAVLQYHADLIIHGTTPFLPLIALARMIPEAGTAIRFLGQNDSLLTVPRTGS